MGIAGCASLLSHMGEKSVLDLLFTSLLIAPGCIGTWDKEMLTIGSVGIGPDILALSALCAFVAALFERDLLVHCKWVSEAFFEMSFGHAVGGVP